MDDTLNNSTVSKQLSKIEREIGTVESKKNKLIDLRLEDSIDKDTYETKYTAFMEKLEQLASDRQKLQETAGNEKDIKRRLKEFKRTLEQNEVLDVFDRRVFERFRPRDPVYFQRFY